MERRDYYLLAARTASTVLAFAAFFSTPPPFLATRRALDVFLAVKAMTAFEMVGGPARLIFHVVSLHGWLGAGPWNYFCYPAVIFEWVLGAVYLMFSAASWGILIDPRFLQGCIGEDLPICQREMLASGLASLMAAITIADALVLLWARSRNRPHFLELLGLVKPSD